MNKRNGLLFCILRKFEAFSDLTGCYGLRTVRQSRIKEVLVPLGAVCGCVYENNDWGMPATACILQQKDWGHTGTLAPHGANSTQDHR